MSSSKSTAVVGHRGWCAVFWYCGGKCDCCFALAGVDSADKAPPRRANDRGHGHREDDSQ